MNNTITKEKKYYEKIKLNGHRSYTIRDTPDIIEQVRAFTLKLKAEKRLKKLMEVSTDKI
jgi:hypothetical protein